MHPLLSVIFNVVWSAIFRDDLVLTLPDGQIQGATYITSNNKTYYGFRGIPYATPPLNDLRFEPPQPVRPWVGVRNASTDSKSCISINYFEESNLESEDCLYINVYVPSVRSKEKLPVMFWIYGGGFTFGSSDKSLYGPDFLIEQDVIVVTHNYRVGPFGFLSTGDKALPGNLGLKDQNLALKWTKKNIKYFGGDPDKITIFGQSAGGASIALHLLSKQSTGLFRAAILQSGSSLCYWAIDNDPKTKAYTLANALPGGNYGNNTQALKDFLKTKSVEQIINATIMSLLPPSYETLSWPTLEEDSDDAFITESPYELIASGNFSQVPIVIGTTAEESLYFFEDLEYIETLASQIDNEPIITIPTNLFQNSSDDSSVIENIRSIYLKNGETFSSNLAAYTSYYSDMKFSRAIIKQAELSSSHVPVYFYQFAYYGRLTATYSDGVKIASHSADLPFLLKDTSVSGTTDTKDVLTQNRVVKLWTNFVKYLNPTPKKSGLFDNLTWPLFNNQSYTYLNINNTLEIRTHIRGKYYSKWNVIYETYGRKPFITF